MRVGIGYDVHRLVEGRPLILGGVGIPFEKGLLGHSDADVLVHAIIRAITGAAGLPDIGELFPDTDPRYKGASSLALLREAARLLREKGMGVVNVDAVIIAEQPKLAPYSREMRENVAFSLGVGYERVGVKAVTEEGLGFTGQGLGMAAQAVVLIERDEAVDQDI